MPRSAPQRLAGVGLPRTAVYGLSVGGAAYLVAITYGPGEPLVQLAFAALLAVGYVAVAVAAGVLRGRHTPTDR